jgi:predicted phosphodiesterase
MTLEEQVKRLRSQGYSYRQIGDSLGISKDTAQKIGRRDKSPLSFEQRDLPPELELSGNLVVVSDIHAETADKNAIEHVVATARKTGIQKIAIVGDMFNMDAFSPFPVMVPPGQISGEISAVAEIITFFAKWFRRIYICRGNHDARISILTLGQIDLENVYDLTLRSRDVRKKVVITPRDRMWLDSPSGRWLLAHQKENSRVRLSVAQKLCDSYQCHVVACHQHGLAVGVSSNGKYVIADNGCLADPHYSIYKEMNTNAFPKWAVGYSFIKNGVYVPVPIHAPLGGLHE